MHRINSVVRFALFDEQLLAKYLIISALLFGTQCE